MTGYKQAIVLKENLGMSRGKMISQACHASLKAYKNASADKGKKWEEAGAKKVVLDSGDSKLEEIYRRSKTLGLPASMVKDAGMTELEPGTRTAVGIGPDEESKIDKITGELKLIE